MTDKEALKEMREDIKYIAECSDSPNDFMTAMEIGFSDLLVNHEIRLFPKEAADASEKDLAIAAFAGFISVMIDRGQLTKQELGEYYINLLQSDAELTEKRNGIWTDTPF